MPKQQQKSPPQARKKSPVSNAVKLDAKNPIPFEYGGTAFSFNQGRRYIPFLHPHDNFFQTLLEAKTLSVTQMACVETKKKYCAGKGLYDVNNKDFSDPVKGYLRRMNAKGESSLRLLRKMFGSHFTFGNTAIELVRFSVGSKRYFYVYVPNILTWRLLWPDDDGIVRGAIHSKLFLREGIRTFEDLKDSRVVPIYDPELPTRSWSKPDEKGVQRTMIWLTNSMDGYDHYGMPGSVSSLMNQVIEYKGNRYNIDNFENNMVLGGILALKGNLSQGEANKVAKDIINAHTGDGKRGRVAVIASEDGIEQSSFHDFKTEKEGSYLKLDENNSQKIILANEWDAMLAGMIHQTTSGRGNTYLKTLYEIKKKTVIDPEQEFMIDNAWTYIQQLADEWLNIGLKDYELGVKDINPISVMADVDITGAVQVNEVRDANGLPVDPSREGEYMQPVKAGSGGQGGGEGV